jgi:glycosyltransferase involved in cell wall biosynthesis
VATNQVDYLTAHASSKRVFLVPHGVDTAYFRPSSRGLPGECRCLFVGQWLRDFETLRRAIISLAKEHANALFTVVTTSEHVHRVQGLPATTVLSGITDAELLAAYHDADLVVLPLLDCTANNGLLEAMACGVPLVTTDVGGVRDYVTAECAELVPVGDADAVCSAITAVLSDRRRAVTMGRAGRERALWIDWCTVSDQQIGILKNV